MKSERRNIVIHPRARKWQWLAAVSGLLLMACFFMPMTLWMPYFSPAPVSPRQRLSDSLDRWRHVDGDPPLVKIFYCNGDIQRFASVYALGAFIALGALGRLWRNRILVTAGSWLLLAAFLLYCLLSPLMLFMVMVHPDYSPQLDVLGFLRNPLGSAALRESVLAPLLALVYVVFSLSRREQGHYCRAFLASLWGFVFFAWIIGHSFPVPVALYGRYVAPVAAGLLLTATIGELAAATGQSWAQAILQLLICRPAPLLDMRGRCPNCSYQLCGLREMRCPECGREFTLAEIHLGAEQFAAPDAAS